jgi:hypothetical protein
MVNIVSNTTKFCEIEIGTNKVPTYSVYINKRTCYVKVMVYDPFSDLLDGYTNSAELVILPIFLRHLKSIGNLMTGENIDRRLFRMLINFLNI